MSVTGGVLILALVCAFCLALSAVTDLDAAALPLPVLSGCVVVLLLAGYAGFLRPGLWCLYGVLSGGAALLGWHAGKEKIRRAAGSAGLWFFAAAGAFSGCCLPSTSRCSPSGTSLPSGAWPPRS
ncbi:MAG: hypothetical protein ACI4OL_00710 [Gemmiger sp.]